MKYVWCCVALGACAHADPRVELTDGWPAQVASAKDYDTVTAAWTRHGELRGAYQEVVAMSATFESPEWRAAHAAREAEIRKLTPQDAAQLLAQAQADAAGPYEVELMVATWDRRENDLQRGKKSVWHVVLVDEQGKEVAPLEIVRDKRPVFVVRAEFPSLADFDESYVARFPRTAALLGPNVRALRLRMSNEQGGLELAWQAP
jgi:hypothetical protein